MKNVIFLVLIVLAVNCPLLATRYYVSNNAGTGNGLSWAQAMSDLQQALAVATAGDEIWIAQGTYLPSQNGDRNKHFNIPNGVALYGGFTGTEVRFEERDWQKNLTVLSGNLGSPEDNSDNSHTIVYFERVSSGTILDGFILIGGSAKALVRGPEPTAAGAAIFNNATDGISSPTIRHCIFKDNVAREGAAIYNHSRNGRCESKIIRCRFLNNSADFKGGAIFNNGDEGVCNPFILECYFEGNRSTYGGSILNSATAGICLPKIEESVFTKNHSDMSGSVLFNVMKGRGQIYTTFTSCQISENHSIAGDDIENNTVNNIFSKQ
jgi:hypothetical protein